MQKTIGIILTGFALVALGWTILQAADAPKGGATALPEWLTSVAKATEAAKESGKLVMANFTGSDWCVWCKTLKAEVFDTQEFKDWADKNVILLELDFPKANKQDEATKKQSKEMLEKHNVKGFPTIVFLKADGSSVGQVGYVKGGPTAWIAKAQEILDTAKKSEK